MRSLSGRIIVGLAILTVGLLLLLGNLGIVEDPAQYWIYWPVIPILLGGLWLGQSLQPGPGGPAWGGVITGGFVLFLGVVYLGRNLDLFTFRTVYIWRMFWPLVLIVVGLTLLRGRAAGPGGRTAFMGGVEIGGTEPFQIQGGSYFAMMGSIEMDLRAAEIPEGETLLDLTAVMGSVEVKVPREVTLLYDGSAVLGGISFLGQEDGGVIASRRTERRAGDEARTLRIQARSFMGSVEVEEI